MDEYTFKDLIINPETPGLDNLIGKEVYFCTVPLNCLRKANIDYEIGILREIRRDILFPFFVEIPSGMIINFPCIVSKKREPKSQYEAFESMEEFIDKYSEVVKGIEYDSFEDGILQWGMWLKGIDDTDKPAYILVSDVKEEGVRLDEHGCFNWEELLSEGFLFPNDMPCGKEKK